jgi:hypothetical protein
MHEIASTSSELALARLAIGAFFFAMRSCEYLKVSGSPRKTKCLTVENIRFFSHGKKLDHTNTNLATASVVSITFVSQKTDVKNQTVTMYRTQDPLLCPVRAWAGIVQTILQDPDGSPSTAVNFHRLANLDKIFLPASSMTKLIRKAADHIGAENLGFHSSDLGTHSIRSGAAMAMHLDAVPTYSIMLIGRWSSDAFMRYIRVQVMEFAQKVASRMIRHQNFMSIPDLDPRTDEGDPNKVLVATRHTSQVSNGGRGTPRHNKSHDRNRTYTPFCLTV